MVTRLLPLALLATTLLSACADNPVDPTTEVVDFSGVYRAGDGTVIELWVDDEEYGAATVREVGSTPLGVPLAVGRKYMQLMLPRDGTEDRYFGYIIDATGEFGQGDVYFTDGKLEIELNQAAIPAQIHWNRISGGSTPQ